jgi:fimbrial isopeptide formation D2 family protein
METLNSDLSISYDAYIREIGDGGAVVVNATTGNATSNQSTVTITSTEIPGGATANTTTQNRSVDVNKSVSNTQDLGSAGNTPGDELTWTISTAISDYFKINNITFTDTMGDGLSFDSGTLSVSVIENGSTVSCAEANLLAGGHLTIVANPSGTTSINLALLDAMADPVNCPWFCGY